MLCFVFLKQTDLKHYTETYIQIKIKSFHVLIRTYRPVASHPGVCVCGGGGGSELGWVEHYIQGMVGLSISWQKQVFMKGVFRLHAANFPKWVIIAGV